MDSAVEMIRRRSSNGVEVSRCVEPVGVSGVRGLACALVACVGLTSACSTPQSSPEEAIDVEQSQVSTPTPTQAPPPPSAPVGAAKFDAPWPPAPLKLMPYVDAPAQGEGQWRPVSDVVRQNVGARPMMFQTTLRHRKLRGPKRDRYRADLYYEVEILVWDAEQVSLRLVGGMAEPTVPREVRDDGLIPQDEAVLGRVVAAFNGGWRTKDAPTSGIMVDGVVGRKPAPEAATVLMYRDGRVQMGTWESADALPEEVHSFRQNIQPIWGQGKVNPGGRKNKWGGTGGVSGADGPNTVRSGLCRTRAGHMAYVYGEHMEHAQLAEAMERAGCVYGMHLDMNGIHAGLEFLHLSDFAPGLRGRMSFKTESARFTPRMYYKPFPRYTSQRPKDFFYLTRQSALPVILGDDLTLKPLPHPGSRRQLPAAAVGQQGSLKVFSWDLARLKGVKDASAHVDGGLQLIVTPSGDEGGSLSLVLDKGRAEIVEGAGPQRALSGRPYSADGEGVIRVLGARGRFMFYAEAPSASRAALEALMKRLGGVRWMALGGDAQLHVQTLADDGRRWVRYDGLSAQGELLGETPSAPDGALIFALPREEALVGPLPGHQDEAP